jgi:hypothetical protein
MAVEQGDPDLALEMKVRCMHCERPLAADGEAFICSFECTFCPHCTAEFERECPNCAGELVARPKRKKGATA